MIAVLDYGIGNLRSAEKALLRVGADAQLITDAQQAAGATGVVLPGVGSFGACMSALRSSGLDRVVYRAVESGTPLLGICVGLQMLYEASDESPGIAGLQVLPGSIKRIVGAAKLPQMQWNRLDIKKPSSLLEGIGSDDWCYFVHSFAAEATDDVVATCDYGGPQTAVVQRGRVWATQFHPEKSSTVGMRVLSNFVREAAA